MEEIQDLDIEEILKAFPKRFLTLSEGISEDRMLLFQNIQKSWKDGVFKNDWNTYIAERSALMAIKSSYRVQKDYNNEVSSQYPKKRKRDDPSTPNKRSDIKQKYPQVAFLKKVKFAPEEPEDENPFRSKNSAERDNQNVVDPINVVDWREWLENVLEVSKLTTYEK
ncbi:hypothetical protein C1645_820273 [Glomus cerebriforme]|uniref:Uncharacterized protein n=1 Tax=Glomus cerebriforme TaxID=658196 RepID=A0A397T371_9GLOM|nr:hypothetical protein C1645_820273 [Glomus cerebriforme]